MQLVRTLLYLHTNLDPYKYIDSKASVAILACYLLLPSPCLFMTVQYM